jgi:hypothetical protein
MVGVTHPHDPYSVPSPFEAPPRSRPVWAWVIAAVMLAAAGIMILTRVAPSPFGADDALAPSTNEPMTLAPPKLDKPKEHSAGGGHSASLPNTRQASGPAWTMQIPRGWTAVDVPNAEEQAAWRTAGGLAGVGDVVTVVHEDMAPLNLHEYVKYQRNVLGVGISTASHIRTSVSHGQGELTYDVIVNGKQARTLQLVVPTTSGFASAIFVAPASTYSTDVKQIRRYLETLTGR